MTDINIHSNTLRTRGGMQFKVLADLREYGYTGPVPLVVWYHEPNKNDVGCVGADGMNGCDSRFDLIDEPKRVECEADVWMRNGVPQICSMPSHYRDGSPGPFSRHPLVGRIRITVEGEGAAARIVGVEKVKGAKE